ncbi:hypothetical protein [Azospirillum sp. SYSU D00513]|uniref:hypothetical protein n=1 Tax=Azospirillum sp. SYSU D00513 TaxID=2812561 RepID=UPI001A96332B|nr:hypothetical protein [Azospirillum sp. SYSU D00513]
MKAIDTLETAKRLRAAGLPEEQAEALTYVLAEIREQQAAAIGEHDAERGTVDLVSKISRIEHDRDRIKQDLDRTKQDLDRTKQDLGRKIESLKVDHQSKINALETARATDTSVWRFLVGFSVLIAAYTVILKAT